VSSQQKVHTSFLPHLTHDIYATTPPVEHLWHWLREDVTYHTCYDQEEELIAQVDRFQARINADPMAIADRLWVKSHLDPEEEKLRVST